MFVWLEYQVDWKEIKNEEKVPLESPSFSFFLYPSLSMKEKEGTNTHRCNIEKVRRKMDAIIK